MIRDAAATDAAAIAKVHVESWEGTYRGLMPDEVIDGLTLERRTAGWSRALADPQPRSASFVAEHDGEVVGMASVGPTRDEDLDSQSMGEVLAIYVIPGHWGHGHGKGLMVASLDWLRDAGYSNSMLWVLDTNSIGRSFYERGGWALDAASKLEDSFGAPINEVRYRLSLEL